MEKCWMAGKPDVYWGIEFLFKWRSKSEKLSIGYTADSRFGGGYKWRFHLGLQSVGIERYCGTSVELFCR